MEFVRVLWHDAADPDATWMSNDEAVAFGKEVVLVESFGWLVGKTPRYLTLAADRITEGTEGPTWGRVTKIPKKMVVSVSPIPLASPAQP